jgi:SpoIIAA-like
MLVTIDGAPAGVIAFEAVGKVSAEDYRSVLTPAIEAAAKAGDEIRLVFELGPRFEGYSIGGVWQDAKLGRGNLTTWNRCAIVSDRDWIRHATHAFGVFMPGEVKVFDVEHLPDALTWAAQ